MVTSPEVILGATFMPESLPVMTANPTQEQWTGEMVIMKQKGKAESNCLF